MTTTRTKVQEIVMNREDAITAIRKVNKYMDKRGRRATRFTNLAHGARRVKWWLIGEEACAKLIKKLAKQGITAYAENNGMSWGRTRSAPNSLIIWIPADMMPKEANVKKD